MRPPRSLLLVATLVLLHHLSLARNLPIAPAGPGAPQCLGHAQNLLRAVSNTLHKAIETLAFYACTSEEIDHEDITKDKTSTVEACLPRELTTNESCLISREISFTTNGTCLASRKASFMMTLCLSSIYEDLKMYQVEFKTINAKLLMDPKRQITLDQNMLGAIDELMQQPYGVRTKEENEAQRVSHLSKVIQLALNSSSETVPPEPSLGELDFYKMKVRFCTLLHAFRVRAVTIERVMSYLNSA